jgi:protein-tyrosine phosphatase
VSTVIDLRNSYEVSVAPNPLSALSGINYVNLSLFDGLALATPMQAEPGIERDALRDVYIRALAERQGAVRDVLIAIADAVPGTVLFHCTVGKDRTGLIAALILSIAEVDIDHVVEDYTLTKAHIFPLLDEMIAGVKARGLDVQNFMPMLDCEPTTMRATLKHIEDRYGSVLHYLAAIGLDVNVIARLRARLLDDFADKVSPGRLR